MRCISEKQTLKICLHFPDENAHTVQLCFWKSNSPYSQLISNGPGTKQILYISIHHEITLACKYPNSENVTMLNVKKYPNSAQSPAATFPIRDFSRLTTDNKLRKYLDSIL